MKLIKGVAVMLGLVFLNSCIKHEIIPAPEPKVNLSAMFSASLNNNPYELIKDKDGFYSEAEQAKEILPSPQLSNVTYFSILQSKHKNDFIKIGIGKLKFSAGQNSSSPSLSVFKDFFVKNKNKSLNFIDDLNTGEGVQITYRDASGAIWYSSETSGDPMNFIFKEITQESDESGDYILFTASFNVTLYNDITNPTSSLELKEAIYQGYFKR